jgi:hypothetical protein
MNLAVGLARSPDYTLRALSAVSAKEISDTTP